MSQKIKFEDFFQPTACSPVQRVVKYDHDVVCGEPDPEDRVLPYEGSSPSLVLDNISTREYGERACLKEVDTMKDGHSFFGRTYVFRGMEGHGEAINKTVALQMAAKETLLKIVDAGMHHKYRMPGTNKKEAKNEKLYVSVIPAQKPAKVAQVDYVGKVITLCQRNKLPPVTYRDEAEGPEHERRFVVTAVCQPLGLVTRSSPASKKVAKHHAAQLILPELERYVEEHPTPVSASSSGRVSPASESSTVASRPEPTVSEVFSAPPSASLASESTVKPSSVSEGTIKPLSSGTASEAFSTPPSASTTSESTMKPSPAPKASEFTVKPPPTSESSTEASKSESTASEAFSAPPPHPSTSESIVNPSPAPTASESITKPSSAPKALESTTKPSSAQTASEAFTIPAPHSSTSESTVKLSPAPTTSEPPTGFEIVASDRTVEDILKDLY
ncbi:unnamed protein product [Bursaphelenchus okinawaensis]|uniref:DRBM domain-containing protein n=1 Tax=Bursaphelenchus okinawaensis TaxID=465554 RepID=A0A811KMH5_9BILA|nr:unnamed protein product [Bursaphelenchus okinawaensis]CAG9107714.1 unnamed protein product [Bursaphelenchus okinawaensis]